MPEPCGKVSYTSAQAKRALAGLRHSKRASTKPVRKSYKCRYCGMYHLTSHPK